MCEGLNSQCWKCILEPNDKTLVILCVHSKKMLNSLFIEGYFHSCKFTYYLKLSSWLYGTWRRNSKVWIIWNMICYFFFLFYPVGEWRWLLLWSIVSNSFLVFRTVVNSYNAINIALFYITSPIQTILQTPFFLLNNTVPKLNNKK